MTFSCVATQRVIAVHSYKGMAIAPAALDDQPTKIFLDSSKTNFKKKTRNFLKMQCTAVALSFYSVVYGST